MSTRRHVLAPVTLAIATETVLHPDAGPFGISSYTRISSDPDLRRSPSLVPVMSEDEGMSDPTEADSSRARFAKPKLSMEQKTVKKAARKVLHSAALAFVERHGPTTPFAGQDRHDATGVYAATLMAAGMAMPRDRQVNGVIAVGLKDRPVFSNNGCRRKGCTAPLIGEPSANSKTYSDPLNKINNPINNPLNNPLNHPKWNPINNPINNLKIKEANRCDTALAAVTWPVVSEPR